MKKKIFYITATILFLFCAITLYSTDFYKIYSLPNSFYANLEEIQNANKNSIFGEFVSLETGQEITVGSNSEMEREIVFKLFGFIPVRKIVAKILPEEEVYVGGNAIGIAVNVDKGIVVSKSHFGEEKNTIASKFFKEGDVIFKINDEEINSLDEISEIVSRSNLGKVVISYYRDNKPYQKEIIAEKDDDSYKLGITVKDDICGIGTLTYVNSKTNEFGALGHPICDNVQNIGLIDGNIYECNLLGIEKGESNKPGQLKGAFVHGRNARGEIEINNNFGVYGKVEDLSIIDTNKTARLGGRLSVSPGKAKIISSVSGIREEYDIEIIKTYSQNSQKEKSFVFRVTDKRLIELTGGIVQGMSGSPIMQNGKIVGAITHVFTSDPTKGYGIYTDWMISNQT